MLFSLTAAVLLLSTGVGSSGATAPLTTGSIVVSPPDLTLRGEELLAPGVPGLELLGGNTRGVTGVMDATLLLTASSPAGGRQEFDTEWTEADDEDDFRGFRTGGGDGEYFADADELHEDDDDPWFTIPLLLPVLLEPGGILLLLPEPMLVTLILLVLGVETVLALTLDPADALKVCREFKYGFGGKSDEDDAEEVVAGGISGDKWGPRDGGIRPTGGGGTRDPLPIPGWTGGRMGGRLAPYGEGRDGTCDDEGTDPSVGRCFSRNSFSLSNMI